MIAGPRITSSTEGSLRKSSDVAVVFTLRLSHEEKESRRLELARSQRVQVREQILDVLRTQHLPVPGHIRPAIANNIGHALVVRGQPCLRKIFILENAFQTWTFFPFGRVGTVTAVAVVVINLASARLLGVESELRIRFAAFHVATRQNARHQHYSACRNERAKGHSCTKDLSD